MESFRYLGLYEYEVDEENYKVVLDVFICEAFAVGTLGEAHAFAEGAVVGFGVSRVQDGDGVAAGDAYWHVGRRVYMAVVERLWE